MLEISFVGNTRLDSLGRRLRVATEKKMTQLTDMLYDKVIENLSGKILQRKSGELASSIRKELDFSADVMIGTVYVEPATAKAEALEYGGKEYYPIVATKASVLHFFTKSGQEVFAKSVRHPPSKEFAYLRHALWDVEELVPEGFREYIQAALAGEDYS